MRITKWVELSEEVEIEIGTDDISAAIGEALAKQETDIDDRPNRHDITMALRYIGQFLRALKDEHIALLTPAQRKVVAKFLAEQAPRFDGGRT